ncbi:hypothetical protein [Photobacterium jeanii]|uniref:hypothetical protein n=1 Tax=Photobacterium jeanii TaxID=858640 RepID=UPI000B1ADDA7|nr:hypothetical protein [Photobacterium jeanii]
MKKIAMACAALLLSASFASSAFTLSGTPEVIPEGAMKYCATSKNFWVCVDNYKQRNNL